MDGAVALAVFDQPAVVLGFLAPVRLPGMLVHQPELPPQEPLAPVGPRFTIVLPLSFLRIDREAVGVVFNQAPKLFPSEIEGGIELLIVFFRYIKPPFSPLFRKIQQPRADGSETAPNL